MIWRPDETNVEMVEMEPEEMEAPAVEMVQVEQPRVLISEVTIEGIVGTPRGRSPAAVCLRRHASASWQPGDSR